MKLLESGKAFIQPVLVSESRRMTAQITSARITTA
jgi:hypothetical protein